MRDVMPALTVAARTRAAPRISSRHTVRKLENNLEGFARSCGDFVENELFVYFVLRQASPPSLFNP